MESTRKRLRLSGQLCFNFSNFSISLVPVFNVTFLVTETSENDSESGESYYAERIQFAAKRTRSEYSTASSFSGTGDDEPDLGNLIKFYTININVI